MRRERRTAGACLRRGFNKRMEPTPNLPLEDGLEDGPRLVRR
jgi:hypothetical protein